MEWPGLSSPDADENLRSSVDFRAVYSSLLEQWFEHDATQLIPNAAGFARRTLIG